MCINNVIYKVPCFFKPQSSTSVMDKVVTLESMICFGLPPITVYHDGRVIFKILISLVCSTVIEGCSEGGIMTLELINTESAKEKGINESIKQQ